MSILAGVFEAPEYRANTFETMVDHVGLCETRLMARTCHRSCGVAGAALEFGALSASFSVISVAHARVSLFHHRFLAYSVVCVQSIVTKAASKEH